MTAVTLAQFIIGDGQVSLGSHIVKPNAKKVRQLKEGVVAGFAGATADAMTLFERLEMKLQEHPETLRACVEMAKAWRVRSPPPPPPHPPNVILLGA